MDKIKKILQGLAESIGKLNRLSLPATILIASIILGGFFYASQVNKQQSIERQQQIELQAKKDADQAKVEADKAEQDKIKRAEALKQLDLSFCLDKANTDYFDYLKLNGTTNKDGSITNATYISDIANKNKQNNIDNCYKQYK